MIKIKTLGAYGSRFGGMATACFLINDKIVVDAGNITSVGKKILKINHIFITHHHLDHIFDIPFLIAESFPQRYEPLTIYGNQENLEALKKNILNQQIWPDFSEINIIGSDRASLRYQSLKAWNTVTVDGIDVLPFDSNHIVPTYGYKISKGNKSVVISGDTWKQDNIWKIANEDPSVKAIFIDVSYPKRLSSLGWRAMHLSTDAFEEEVSTKLKRDDIILIVYHIKPTLFREVEREIKQVGRKLKRRIIIAKDNDVFKF